MSLMSNFNANVIVSEQMERLMVLAAQELACKVVYACGEHYSFDAEEAINLLGLGTVQASRNKPSKGEKVVTKVVTDVVTVKTLFPLPYSGECNDALCHGLRQNNSLFTQCQAQRKVENQFCKSCQSLADKNGGIPEYGTIEQRQAVGIFEYVDPKGRKPIAYTKIMKKFQVSQEQVMEEAGKIKLIVDVNHFKEDDGKRGRPSSKKEKEVNVSKGAKGRPKKMKKVLEIEGEEDDLFASLVASANLDDEEEEEEEEELVVKPVKKGKTDEESEAQCLKEKEEKEAKIAAEKEEKEAKIAAEKEAKEAKIAAEKEAKVAKEAQRLKEKEEKEAKLAAEKEAKEEKIASEKEAKEAKIAAEKEIKAQHLKEKEAAKAAKKAPESNAAETEEEPDVVKKIEYEGKKYLKSKKSGIIYDYKEWTQNQDQVVVGMWNESRNKIDFTTAVEESEEESEEVYEEED